MKRIELKIKITNAKLSPEYETDPSVCLWNTINRSGRLGETLFHVPEWDPTSGSSGTFVVYTEIPAKYSENRSDDTVYVELRSKTKNYEGRESFERTGFSKFSVPYLVGLDMDNSSIDVSKKPKKWVRSDIITDNYIKNDQFYVKGNMMLGGVNIPDSLRKAKWNSSRIDFIESNTRELSGRLNSIVSYPERVYSEDYPSISQGIRDIHAPFWYDSGAMVPTPFYLRPLSEGDPDELVYVNCCNAVLQRNLPYGSSMNDFKKDITNTIDAFFNSNGKISSVEQEKMVRACRIMMCIPTILANSLDYKSDSVYVKEESRNSYKKEPAEIFSDALSLEADDCEGLAKISLMSFYQLRRGLNELRNDTFYWRRYGGWNDQFLGYMQRLSYHYTGFAALGTVTSAKLENSEGKIIKPIIGSDTDQNMEVGGHMWAEMCPNGLYDSFSSKKIKRNPDFSDLERNLPYGVLEGTGISDPLQMPLMFYGKDSKSEKRLREYQIKTIQAHEIVANTNYISLGLRQSIQTTLDDDKRRSTTFYRESSEIFSWNEKFEPDHSLFMTEMNGKMYVGANLKDRLNASYVYSTKGKYSLKRNVRISLKRLKSPSEEDNKMILSLCRHIKPPMIPTLSEKSHTERLHTIGEKINVLNSKRPNIKGNVSDSLYIRREFAVFRGSQVLDGVIISRNNDSRKDLSTSLTEELENRPEIVDYEYSLESITDSIYNITLSMYIDTRKDPASVEMNNSLAHPFKKNIKSANQKFSIE